jgi:hypothetical protein
MGSRPARQVASDVGDGVVAVVPRRQGVEPDGEGAF